MKFKYDWNLPVYPKSQQRDNVYPLSFHSFNKPINEPDKEPIEHAFGVDDDGQLCASIDDPGFNFSCIYLSHEVWRCTKLIALRRNSRQSRGTAVVAGDKLSPLAFYLAEIGEFNDETEEGAES